MHKSVPFLFTCLLGLTLAGCASIFAFLGYMLGVFDLDLAKSNN